MKYCRPAGSGINNKEYITKERAACWAIRASDVDSFSQKALILRFVRVVPYNEMKPDEVEC